MRIKIKKTHWLFCFLALLVFWPLPASAQQDLTIRLGELENITRLVFDWPHFVAYEAARGDNSLRLDFDKEAHLSLPDMETRHLKNISALATEGKKFSVEILAVEGASIHHYRLLRRVIVDIHAPGTAPLRDLRQIAREIDTYPELALTPAPKESTDPTTRRAEPVAPATPAPRPPPTRPAQTTVETGPPVQAAPVPEVAQEEMPLPPEMEETPVALEEDLPEPEEAPTVISFSTLTPAALAVFARRDHLWILLNTQTSSVPPSLAGPRANFLGRPKLLQFEGGVAYRYTLPEDLYVSILREAQNWKIVLSPSPRLSLSKGYINPLFDGRPPRARLVANLPSADTVMQFPDPDVGDMLYVVPVTDPGQRIDRTLRNADLEVLPAIQGLVVRPLNDALRVHQNDEEIIFSTPDGLLLTPPDTATVSLPLIREADTLSGPDRLFDFPNWRQGGPGRLMNNKTMIERAIARAQTSEEKAEGYVQLAILLFANTFGHEALGALRLAISENENLENNTAVLALRGASAALAGHHTQALEDLSNPALRDHPEAQLWVGYAAASTEQWRRAERAFPKDNHLLARYPGTLSVRLTLFMTESALRSGKLAQARRLMETLEAVSSDLDYRQRAALNYLQGEAFRQEGDFEEALRLWRGVAGGRDRLYHAKASLATALLQLQENRISLEDAVDRVDGLRFAWRGDGLEVLILHELGRLQVKNKEYLAGLENMRRAVELARENLEDTDLIAEDMIAAFHGLFVEGRALEIPALEAIAIFNSFGELMPVGQDEVKAGLLFADLLINMDLLDQAARVLEEITRNPALPAPQKPAVGKQLAAVYLLDGKPEEALAALRNTAGPIPASDRDLETERVLLRARALSQQGQTEPALSLLEGMDLPAAHKLKADILWRARQWEKAGDTIADLLPDPAEAEAFLPDETARLVLNAAVAYRLADRKEKLETLRETWQNAMNTTPHRVAFGVVSRPPGQSSLADRETILSIAGETDMFKGFLDSYKTLSGNGT